MKRICYKVLLTLVMLLGAIGAQAQTTGKVYVMDDFSEDAIAGAQVRISLDGEVLAEGVTDEEGCYDYELNPALESVTPCMLSVTADGYLSYEKSVRIDPAAASYERVFDVYLVENKAILSVTVTDTPNGEKIEGATVRLLCDGEAIAEAVTNKNGKCTVKAAEVKEGAKYVVSAEAPDYNPAETEVVPVMGETVDCSVKMSLTTPATTGRIFVYIKDDEWGERVTGALVKLSRNGETVCEGTTDDNGRFAFKIVPALTEAETFTVNVTAENYLPYDGEITVNPAASLSDRTYDIDLALANPITELDVWVGDAAEEKEIAGANVRLSCNGELIGEDVTDEWGTCAFIINDFDETAKYMVAVDAEGYASQEVEAKTVYGKKEWCDVFMTAQAAETSTTGKVFVFNSDSDWEERIEGAEVVITDGEKVLCEGLTNSNGRFDFEIKPALESSLVCTLKVSAEGFEPMEMEITIDPAADAADRVYDVFMRESNPATELSVWVGDQEGETSIEVAKVTLKCVEETIGEETTGMWGSCFFTIADFDKTAAYTLTVEASGYEAKTVEVQPVAGECTNVDILIGRYVGISGIEDGRAVRVVEDGIAVANGTAVRVFDLTGATVAATDGAAQTIRLDAGIYIIVTENSCEKIIIR